MGNVTSAGTWQYSYGDDARLNQATSGATAVRYWYDGMGQRVAKHGFALRYYAYDEMGRTIGEYGSGDVIDETVYLGDLPVAVLGQSLNYVFADHLNAPRVLEAANDGAVTWSWLDTDPFGSGSATPSTIVGEYNHRFPGQIFDVETGLHYNYFRDYDPQTGRYIESDPVGLAAGVNTYTYVGGSPVLFVDPSGLTRAQVDCMLEKVRTNNPDLNVPHTVDISSNFDGQDTAVTNPATMKVTLSNYYNGDLDRDGMYSLYKTLTHESIHRTKGRLDMIRRPFKHPDIYEEAAKRAQEFFKKEESNACTCAK